MNQQKFIVEVLRQAFIEDQPGYCELGFFSVLAASTDKAGAKAEAFSRSQERVFRNPQGQRVVWKFVRVIEVSPALSEVDAEVVEIHALVYQDMESFNKAVALRGFHRLEADGME